MRLNYGSTVISGMPYRASDVLKMTDEQWAWSWINISLSTHNKNFSVKLSFNTRNSLFHPSMIVRVRVVAQILLNPWYSIKLHCIIIIYNYFICGLQVMFICKFNQGFPAELCWSVKVSERSSERDCWANFSVQSYDYSWFYFFFFPVKTVGWVFENRFVPSIMMKTSTTSSEIPEWFWNFLLPVFECNGR